MLLKKENTCNCQSYTVYSILYNTDLIVWKLLEFPAMVDDLCSYFLSGAVFLQMSTKRF